MALKSNSRRRELTGVTIPGAPTVELTRVTGVEPELIRHRAQLELVAGLKFPYPAQRFAGRGIVICGGGAKYFPCVYVLVRLLRHLGCGLPVEVWHLGEQEMSPPMRGLLAAHGVVCVDALAMRRVHPARRLNGWELKCYALLHSAFAEVLLLDADNCPVREPAFLFDMPEYREHGAVFWPDFWRFRKGDAVWTAAGIPPRKAREAWQFESGQILVDKARCWRALSVAMHLNEHSDWWYRLLHGDKDTFFLAWAKLGQRYAMPPHPVRPLEGTMLQHDFSGKLLFQHRNFGKWTLENNRHIPGFRLEDECLAFVAELRAQWTPGLPPWVRKWEPSNASKPLRTLAAKLCRAPLEYARAGLGTRTLDFRPDGTIGTGTAGCERWWDLRLVKGGTRRSARVGGGKNGPGTVEPPEARAERRAPPTVQLEVFGENGLTFRAHPIRGGSWKGAWVAFERCKMTLRPIRARKKSAQNGELGRQEDRNGKSAGKAAVFHVETSKRNGREAVGDVPKCQPNNGEPVQDMPKSHRNSRKRNGDATPRPKNGRKTVGDVPKSERSIPEAVLDEAGRRRINPPAIRDTDKHPRNGRKAVGDAANTRGKTAPDPGVPAAKLNGSKKSARKQITTKTNRKVNKL